MRQKWQLGADYISLGKEIKELKEEISKYRYSYTYYYLAPDDEREIARKEALAAAEILLTEKTTELALLRCKAEEILESLPVRERRLLRLRYFHGKSWQEIALKLYYDESTCRRIHRALLRSGVLDVDTDIDPEKKEKE